MKKIIEFRHETQHYAPIQFKTNVEHILFLKRGRLFSSAGKGQQHFRNQKKIGWLAVEIKIKKLNISLRN